MGKLIEVTLINGKKGYLNKDEIEFLVPDGDITKIFFSRDEKDYIRVNEDYKKVVKKIYGEIRVSLIDIFIFVLFLVFIIFKLLQ
nr:MAG TPA: Flagellar and Swarming motility protein [Caudoviricetes sp.]